MISCNMLCVISLVSHADLIVETHIFANESKNICCDLREFKKSAFLPHILELVYFPVIA